MGPRTEHGLAQVNGTTLYYEISGSGDPLVLVHGFSLDCRMWDPQFQLFTETRRVLRYDLRGFGRSALPRAERFEHGQDLRALMEYIGIAKADVLGLSLGGMVAIDHALTYPEATRSLVLADALYAGFQWSPEWEERTGLLWELGRELGSDSAKESGLSHPIFDPIWEIPEAGAFVRKLVDAYSGWHFVNNNPARSPQPPAAQRLADLRMPVLAVVGERDLPDFHVMASTLVGAAGYARMIVLPRVGHMVNLEAPLAFNQAVLEFLDSR